MIFLLSIVTRHLTNYMKPMYSLSLRPYFLFLPSSSQYIRARYFMDAYKFTNVLTMYVETYISVGRYVMYVAQLPSWMPAKPPRYPIRGRPTNRGGGGSWQGLPLNPQSRVPMKEERNLRRSCGDLGCRTPRFFSFESFSVPVPC